MMNKAIILCGGNSSRFNYQNKAFLKYDHRVFLQKIIDELVSFDIILSAKDSELYSSFNQKIICDTYNNIGPMAGIIRGLESISSGWGFITTCDIPNITARFISYMQEFISSDFQVVIPKDRQGRLHPLCGFYHSSIIATIREQIVNKNYKIHDLINICKVKIVKLDDTNFNDYILFNINSEEDYHRCCFNPKIIAISGVKNSGKTTLITRLIKELVLQKYTVATIKHTSHSYPFDIEDSDTYLHKQAGASAVCIYSPQKKMIIQDDINIQIGDLINDFSCYDIILLEGFKETTYPKIEVIRKEISTGISSNPQNLLAIVTDLPDIIYKKKIAFSELTMLVKLILNI